MSNRRCLAAFTPCAHMPPYISVTQFDDGDVEVTVRSPCRIPLSNGFPDYGPTASIRMTREQFATLCADTAKEFRR